MAGFPGEALEYLEMLDEGLLAFESKAGNDAILLTDPDDQERMNTMFRAAHSLKGLAAASSFRIFPTDAKAWNVGRGANQPIFAPRRFKWIG